MLLLWIVIALGAAPPAETAPAAPPAPGRTGERGPAGARRAAPIPWRFDRPLRWSDFLGTAPEPSPHLAFTETTLGIRTSSQVITREDRLGWTAFVSLDKVDAEAVFEPSKSWVAAGGRTDAILAHEQIHFDLAHLEALRATKRILRELGDRRFTARGPDEAAAAASARRAYDREIDRLTREAHETLARRNRQYDEETSHGANDAEQRRWAGMIDRELREAGVPRPRRAREVDPAHGASD